jgi:photosystem II stability/assembly factor-like uncharacterized protein
MSLTKADKALIELDLKRYDDMYKKFDPKAWEKSIEIKRKMGEFTSASYDPKEEVLSEREDNNKKVGVFIGELKSKITIQSSKNPNENGSFGFIDTFAEITSEESFIPGILVLFFNPKNLKMVSRDTLRLFRWDEKLQVFLKINCSGIGSDRDYVWGRITQPGIYAIIGLNSHPLLSRTIKMSVILAQLMRRLDHGTNKQLQQKILDLAIRSPELSKAIQDPEVLEGLIQDSWIQGLPDPLNLTATATDSPLDTSLPESSGIDLSRLPEFDLINVGGGALSARKQTVGVFPVDSGWESIGPINFSGCIYQIAIDPNNNNCIYAAAADGGLWRLIDVHSYPYTTWVPLTDNDPDVRNLRIDAVAIAPSNSNVIYIADRFGYLYRSENRGTSWMRTSSTQLGREDGHTFRAIQKIIVDPTNQYVVYVASNFGFWKSDTGGTTWQSNTGQNTLRDGDVTDAAIDPESSSIIYIGVRGVGLEKSENGGIGEWRLIAPVSTTDPEQLNGMIKVAVGRQGSISERVVAVKFHRRVYVNRHSGLRDWVDKGMWGQLGTGDQANYDNVIAIDPFNDNVILAGLQELYRTEEGITEDVPGTWVKVAGSDTTPYVHEDQQSIAFDPLQRNIVYLSNDGGVYKSRDGGRTWQELNFGLVTTQFFTLGISGNRALGNVYHWGDLGVRNLGGFGTNMWEIVEGGGMEFPHVIGDLMYPNTFYFLLGDSIRRRFYPYPTTYLTTIDLNHSSAFFARFNPVPDALDSIAVKQYPNSQTMVAGMQNPVGIMRTRNGRSNRFEMSDGIYYPQTTWSEETVNNMGTSPIVSIAFSLSNPDKVYAISRAGEVYKKTNIDSDSAWEMTGSWTGVTIDNGVKQLAVNPMHENRLYAITGNKVARSIDGGQNWHEIPGASPNELPLSDSKLFSIAAYPFDGQILFVSTNNGIFVTVDEGASWRTFDDGLPNVEIRQIIWSGVHLYAITHGRGVWRRRLFEYTDKGQLLA